MKAILCGIILGTASLAANAQQEQSTAHFKESLKCDLYCKLYQTAAKYDSLFSKQYAHLVAFIFFNIDTAGNVVDIKYFWGVPKYITDFAKEALHATDGDWIPAKNEGRPVKSRPFVLPIVCELEMVHQNLPPDADLRSNQHAIQNVLMMRFDKRDTSEEAQFIEPHRMPPLDCILLSPLHLAYMSTR